MVSGGYGGGDIPVPIPNTAVKPTSADGTWGFPPGRVGRRRDFLKTPHLTVGGFRIFGFSKPAQRRFASWFPKFVTGQEEFRPSLAERHVD